MKTRGPIWLVGMAFLGILLGGCGTMFQGTEAKITLNSSPAGANVTIQDTKKGKYQVTATTPATVKVKRKYQYNVTFNKDGYEKVEESLHRQASVYVLLDLLIPYLWIPGVIIDASTGGWYKITPDNLSVTLNPKPETMVQQYEYGAQKASGKEYRPPNIPLGAYHGPKYYLAVMDLENKARLTKEEVAMLSDKLRGAFLQTGRYTVVDRNHMNVILREQAQQQMDCNSSACAVEIGRILNVEKMALSKVGRLGDTYYLTLSLVNVETGEIEASSEEECPCNVEELPLAMDVIVKKLIVSLAK